MHGPPLKSGQEKPLYEVGGSYFGKKVQWTLRCPYPANVHTKGLPQSPPTSSIVCSGYALPSIYLCLPIFPPWLDSILWITPGQISGYTAKYLSCFCGHYHSGSFTVLLSEPALTFGLVNQMSIPPHKSSRNITLHPLSQWPPVAVEWNTNGIKGNFCRLKYHRNAIICLY